MQMLMEGNTRESYSISSIVIVIFFSKYCEKMEANWRLKRTRHPRPVATFSAAVKDTIIQLAKSTLHLQTIFRLACCASCTCNSK